MTLEAPRDRLTTPWGAGALLLLAVLALVSCTVYGPSPAAVETMATAAKDDFEVVAEVAGDGAIERAELLAPKGALRSGGAPDEPPYVWLGAPLALRLQLVPEAGPGSLEIVWSDERGETVAKVFLTSAGGAADRNLQLPVPATEELGAGTFRGTVRYDPHGPGRPGELSIDFAIGAPAQASIDPPAPAFPWPPPRPATRHVLATERLGTAGAPATLGEAADRLLAALGRAGYAEHSFFSIQPNPDRPPEGFALVTRLEQIEPDGAPKPVPDRWSVELPARELFSLGDFVRALFTAPEGHYRVIVFTLTGLPVAPGDEEPTRDQASDWLGSGLAHLPAALADLPWTRDHVATALIYQFRQVGAGNDPEVNPPDAPPARDQLERTGILSALGGAP